MVFYFLKLNWEGIPPHPYILVADETGKIEKRELIHGETINLKINDLGFCIGTELDRGVWISCQENQSRHGKTKRDHPNEVTQGNQCSLCLSEDFFSCRKICTGNFCNPSSQKAFDLCQPAETAVYLTKIGDKNKVGVSLNPLKRWVEQGSDFATWVIKLPGLEARKVEHEISGAFNFSLQVSSKYKSSQLHQKMDGKSLEELEMAIEAVKQTGTAIAKERGKPVVVNPDPTFQSLSKYYGDLDAISRPVQEIKIDRGVEIGGKIIAIKGPLIVIEKNGYFFSVNSKKLSGCSFTEIENANVKTQFSLDDWF